MHHKEKEKDKAQKTKENLSEVTQPGSDKAETRAVEPTATQKLNPQASAGSYCVLSFGHCILFWGYGNNDYKDFFFL